MRTLIRWLIEPILFRRIIRAIDWTELERAQFDSFCRTGCGIKLFEFLRQLAANTTFKAVYHDAVSANAHARGMQDLLGVFYRLRVFPNQEESEESLEDAYPMPKPAEKAKNVANFWTNSGGRGAISK